jgi:hypothetical protein
MFPHFGWMTITYIICQKKSEINTSYQEVGLIEYVVLLSTEESFTDLGHVRIIFDNAIWFIWLWMWQTYCTK